MNLSSYPAWRTLGETLRELACLLRGAGAELSDLAAQVEALLDEPASAIGALPGEYRVQFPLAGRRQPELEAWEIEGQLQSWLAELTRHLADVPLLLAAPAAAEALGQSLTGELPRAWGARLAVPLFGLRQQVRGARSGRAPVSLPDVPVVTAPLQVVAGDGQTYHVVMPAAAGPEVAVRARRELLYLILRDLGPDAARLHLLLCAAPDGVTETEVRRALGATRAVAADRAYAALAALRRVRLSLLSWAHPDGALAWERQPLSLWDVHVREYGQACLDERSGALAAHGTQWAFLPRPGSWGSAPDGALSGESRTLLEELNGRRDGFSLATAVLLSLADGDEVVLPHEAVCTLGRAPVPERNRLRASARLQRHRGWEPNFADDASVTYRRIKKDAGQGEVP